MTNPGARRFVEMRVEMANENPMLGTDVTPGESKREAFIDENGGADE